MVRRFTFVPFGGHARDDAIACDGLVPGATLDLSHWSGNRTPAEYRRDTSTESALAYAADPRADAALGVVSNNHFDTDGLLSVWALVEPEAAQRRASLLVAAAEAGDFGAWPEDERGLQVDAAIESLGATAGGDAHAYVRALSAVAGVLDDLDKHSSLWTWQWEALLRARARAEAGALDVWAEGSVAAFVHRSGEEEMPAPMLSRLSPKGARRWLLAFDRGGGTWDYKYERPGWAWAETVVRPRIPTPSRNACVRNLGPGWAIKGDLGMTGICRTAAPVRMAPREVVGILAVSDPGL